MEMFGFGKLSHHWWKKRGNEGRRTEEYQVKRAQKKGEQPESISEKSPSNPPPHTKKETKQEKTKKNKAIWGTNNHKRRLV